MLSFVFFMYSIIIHNTLRFRLCETIMLLWIDLMRCIAFIPWFEDASRERVVMCFGGLKRPERGGPVMSSFVFFLYSIMIHTYIHIYTLLEWCMVWFQPAFLFVRE
jgi:hypothetical protein